MFACHPCPKVKSLSRVHLFATPWTVAHQIPLSMEFSGQEHWSGSQFPFPGDLPDPGIKPWSLALQLPEYCSTNVSTALKFFVYEKG